MIITANNKILKVGNKIFQRKVKNLTYLVFGNRFPFGFYSTSPLINREAFLFYSNKPNSVIVSYGDGVAETYNFVKEGTVWKFGWRGPSNYYGSPQPYDPAVHYYTDGNTGDRFIDFLFEDLEAITYNPIFGISIKRTPIEYIYTSIYEIQMSITRNIIDLPTIPKQITNLSIGELVFQSVLQKIPDQWFEAKGVTLINFRQGFNLSDVIASNFFKLNQWKLLKSANLLGCNIQALPMETINELQLLETLVLEANPLTAIPPFGSLPNLKFLTLSGNTSITNTTIPNWNGLPKLQYIDFTFSYDYSYNIRLDYSTIPTNWAGLFSIVLVNAYVRDNAHNDEFINAFYTLCTTNGSIVNNGAALPYRNRFRNIAWGRGTLGFTGAKVAPTGYVQGVSNGTPTTQGQKVYVLQNQYNHTVTHGTPIT